jgi:hypothetical protein
LDPWVQKLLVGFYGNLYSGDKDNPAGCANTVFGALPGPGSPCYNHDRCYHTCDPSDAHRNQCNSDFLTDLYAVCLGAENQACETRCFIFAQTYWEAVSDASQIVFPQSQRAYCRCC